MEQGYPETDLDAMKGFKNHNPNAQKPHHTQVGLEIDPALVRL